MQRQNQGAVNDKSDDKGVICCVDSASCRHRGRIRPLPSENRPITSSMKTSNTSIAPSFHSNNNIDATAKKIDGQAIFCLHDDDPNWVQGYFIPRGSKKPWGMLAIQEEIDDCMACSAGGYRRLSLNVYHRSGRRQSASNDPQPHRSDRSSGSNNNENKIESKSEKPCKIEGVDWTGGDMMTLYHPQYVDMEGERLLTVSIMCPVYNSLYSSIYVYDVYSI